MARATLRDVAERSGFSVTTVSQVLNDVPGKRIPESTRARVRAAAAELSYTPNRLAQGLRLRRTNTLGFISDHIATSPHAGQTIVGAQDAAADYGSLLLLMNSGSDEELENREIQALRDRQVDGIVYAAEYHRILVPPAALTGIPTVLLDARPAAGEFSSVVPDEVGGAVTAVKELIDHGHRRIAFVTNITEIPATALRLDGYKKALKSAHRPFPAPWWWKTSPRSRAVSGPPASCWAGPRRSGRPPCSASTTGWRWGPIRPPRSADCGSRRTSRSSGSTTRS